MSGDFSRKYDPADMSELDKLALDEIIQAYWARSETVSFDEFFFYQYNLYEFTKKELIYMDINGDILFHLLSFAKDDKDYVTALKKDPAI